MEASRNGTYETSDIVLASYLFASGTNLLELDRSNPQRIVFVFASPKPELISKWQEGTATANVLAYHNAYKNLLAKLYGRKR